MSGSSLFSPQGCKNTDVCSVANCVYTEEQPEKKCRLSAKEEHSTADTEQSVDLPLNKDCRMFYTTPRSVCNIGKKKLGKV